MRTRPCFRDPRRLVDAVVAGAAIVALGPAVPVVAAAIKLDSPGPVLFRQRRAGRGGAPFEMLKLRTMVVDAERCGPAVAGRDDPRITRVGRILRASKVDELPQLWNVLRGHMTLIGPRAEVPELLARYDDRQLSVLAVKPGLTGPGQLYFTLHQARELDDVEDPVSHHLRHQLGPKIDLDLAYLERRTWASDLALVAVTLSIMVGRRPTRFLPAPLRPADSSPSP
jgi:lipopolysaccharide/colanic/teichoic acid biosynthesis glycosyltransferase